MSIHIVCDWGTQVGVDVAINKTVKMLRYVTEVRYLGIAMAKRMRFYVQLDHIREKLTVVVLNSRHILRNIWERSYHKRLTIHCLRRICCICLV